MDWLSTATGQRYHLPSEAEFEYANRAGSAGAYWWGNGAPREVVANLRGEHDRALADGTWEFTPLEKDYLQAGGAQPLLFAGYGDGYWWPAPVASFTANRFGVHDMTGNVWEWTADCWHDDYTGAPADGRVWAESADCESRVVRGGSFTARHATCVRPTAGGAGPSFAPCTSGFVRRAICSYSIFFQ